MDQKETTARSRKRFRNEFADCWRRVPNKALFLGLLAAWLALFHFLGNSTFGYVDTPSLFGWMHNAYTSGDSDPNPETFWGKLRLFLVGGGDESHGKLIPLVVLALFWWKRDRLLALPAHVWPPALALLAGALVLHIVGYMVQQPRISIVAMFAGVYALIGLAWGRAWMRESFFPFFLFAFCVPVGSLAEHITFPLRMVVTHLSVGISHFLGVDVIREGTQIFDPHRSFRYDVAPACSGIRSLVSLLALTTIYGFVVFRSPWRRVVMMISAAPLAVLGNTARITLVIMIAEAFGQEAGAWVEQKLGLITFAVAIVCMLALAYWIRERPAPPQPALPQPAQP